MAFEPAEQAASIKPGVMPEANAGYTSINNIQARASGRQRVRFSMPQSDVNLFYHII